MQATDLLHVHRLHVSTEHNILNIMWLILSTTRKPSHQHCSGAKAVSIENSVVAGRFIGLESLRSGDDELQVLISSEKLYFVGRCYEVVLLVPFEELLHCQYIRRG